MSAGLTTEQKLCQELCAFSHLPTTKEMEAGRRVFVFWVQTDPSLIRAFDQYIDRTQTQKTGLRQILAFQCMIPDEDPSLPPTSFMVGYLSFKGCRSANTVRAQHKAFQNMNLRLLAARIQVGTVENNLVDNERLKAWRLHSPEPFIYNDENAQAARLAAALEQALPEDDPRKLESKALCIQNIIHKLEQFSLQECLAIHNCVIKTTGLREQGKPSPKYRGTVKHRAGDIVNKSPLSPPDTILPPPSPTSSS